MYEISFKKDNSFKLFSVNLSFAEKKAPENVPGTTRVTAEQVIDLLGKEAALIIIDSRKTSDRNKGYIEGSIGLQDTDTTPAALAKHISSKTTPVVFYCNGEKCGRSVVASKIAVSDGYKNIYWFRGGWDEWSAKGLPVMKD
jgi:rhodanese-related sulfurtransferase